MPEAYPPHPGYVTIVFAGSPEEITKIINVVQSDAVPGEISGMAHSDEMTRFDVIEEIMEDKDIDGFDKVEAFRAVAHADDPQAAWAAWRQKADLPAAA